MITLSSAHLDVDAVRTVSRLGARRWVQALALGGLASVAIVVTNGAQWWWVAGVLVPATASALIDQREERLPAGANVAIALFGIVTAMVLVGPSGVVAAGSGAAMLSLPLFVLHLVSPASMGFGDVMFAAALGTSVAVASTSATRPLLAAVALAIASGLALTAAAVRTRRAVPFGFPLLVGVAVALWIGGQMSGTSLPWR